MVCFLRGLFFYAAPCIMYVLHCTLHTARMVMFCPCFVALLGILQQAIQRNSNVCFTYCTVSLVIKNDSILLLLFLFYVLLLLFFFTLGSKDPEG